MSIAPGQAHVTLEQLLASDARGRCELVDGHLEEVNASNLSSAVAVSLATLLRIHCKADNLGQVFGADAYYQCCPDGDRKARKPDVSLVSTTRLPGDWMELGYFTIPPDLAVEVLSPNELAYEVDRKIAEYLNASVQLVWEVDPVERTVMIHRADGTVQRLRERDTLSGESVVRGFQCIVADFLL